VLTTVCVSAVSAAWVVTSAKGACGLGGALADVVGHLGDPLGRVPDGLLDHLEHGLAGGLPVVDPVDPRAVHEGTIDRRRPPAG
jgi:hypothetical protein